MATNGDLSGTRNNFSRLEKNIFVPFFWWSGFWFPASPVNHFVCKSFILLLAAGRNISAGSTISFTGKNVYRDSGHICYPLGSLAAGLWLTLVPYWQRKFAIRTVQTVFAKHVALGVSLRDIIVLSSVIFHLFVHIVINWLLFVHAHVCYHQYVIFKFLNFSFRSEGIMPQPGYVSMLIHHFLQKCILVIGWSLWIWFW